MSVAKERGPYGFTHPLPLAGVAAEPHKEPRAAVERSRGAGSMASDNASYRSQVGGTGRWVGGASGEGRRACGVVATCCGWLATDSVFRNLQVAFLRRGGDILTRSTTGRMVGEEGGEGIPRVTHSNDGLYAECLGVAPDGSLVH